jgi:hypothetical protein
MVGWDVGLEVSLTGMSLDPSDSGAGRARMEAALTLLRPGSRPAQGLPPQNIELVKAEYAGEVRPGQPFVAVSNHVAVGPRADRGKLPDDSVYVVWAKLLKSETEAAAPSASSRPTTQAAGGKLEFRIAPYSPSAGKTPAMSALVVQFCMDLLKEGRIGRWWVGIGTWTGPIPSFIWLPIAGELTNADMLVTGEYEGQKYVLVSDKPAETMLRGEGKNAWGLAKVYATTEGLGQPAVGFELDDRGAELFAAFTKANVGNALAVVVDGRVVSAPVLRSSLGKQGTITGRFTAQEVAALVQALKAGMPPQKSPTPSASSGPSTEGARPQGPSTQPAAWRAFSTAGG